MKKFTDDDLQRMLDEDDIFNDATAGQTDDIKAYQLLYTNLKKAPKVKIPANFAANVVAQLQAQGRKRSILQFYLAAVVVLIVSLCGIYALLLKTNYLEATRLTTILMPYKWAFVFTLFSLLAIQYMDQKLVREPKGLV